MLKIDNLRVTFNQGDILENKALRGINLLLEQEQFITVIGSNGSGKSTLLNTIAGTIKPTSGSLTLDGQDITALPQHRRAPSITRVFQDPLAGTCPHLSIEENMALALNRRHKRFFKPAINAERQEFFRSRLSVLNLKLENRLQEPVSRLSGGQRQALSLVMATLDDSKILLLDEHTAALDPQMSDLVMRLSIEFTEQFKLTTLMVTHSMQTALNVGSRTIMLHQGQIVLDLDQAQREKTTVPELIEQFQKNTQFTLDSDSMLLA